MVRKENIRKIKNSVVAIGLRTMGEDLYPVSVHGSGFLVDKKGFVVTASHVLEECLKQKKQLEEEGEKAWPAIFSYVMEGNGFRIITNSITDFVLIRLTPSISHDEIDLDVALCKLKDPEPNHDFLEISKRKDYDVFDEILVCGYPGGQASLDLRYNVANMKTSPIIQHGRISAFLPADNVITKEAITTDIIGTGGSSGSPIILADDCKVIGIAQWVISSSVLLYGDGGNKSGISNIGLISGIANPLFEDLLGIIEQMKSGDTKVKFTAHHSKITSKRIR